MTACIEIERIRTPQFLHYFHNPRLLKQTNCSDAGGASFQASPSILHSDSADGQHWHAHETG